jgi:hypothetical protein
LGTIAVANINTPTTWNTTTPTSISANFNGFSYVDCYGHFITVGGNSSDKKLQRLNKSRNLVMQNLNALSVTTIANPTCWHIGHRLYCFGYNSQNIQVSDMKDFAYWEDRATRLLSTSSYINNAEWIGTDRKLYYVNPSDRHIYMSGTKDILAETQDANSSLGLLGKELNGYPTCVSRSTILGFKSWLTTRTDMA